MGPGPRPQIARFTRTTPLRSIGNFRPQDLGPPLTKSWIRTWRQTPPSPVNRITDACKNITGGPVKIRSEWKWRSLTIIPLFYRLEEKKKYIVEASSWKQKLDTHGNDFICDFKISRYQCEKRFDSNKPRDLILDNRTSTCMIYLNITKGPFTPSISVNAATTLWWH